MSDQSAETPQEEQGISIDPQFMAQSLSQEINGLLQEAAQLRERGLQTRAYTMQLQAQIEQKDSEIQQRDEAIQQLASRIVELEQKFEEATAVKEFPAPEVTNIVNVAEVTEKKPAHNGRVTKKKKETADA